MSIIKNIGAILAGFLTVVVLLMGTDALLESLKIFPPINTGIQLLLPQQDFCLRGLVEK
jgi:hypothetical protein